MKQGESALKEGWTSSCRTSVGAAGNLKVVDHTLKHLLYEEEEIVDQMSGLAVRDSAGNSAGSSASSGTYYSATEGGEEG